MTSEAVAAGTNASDCVERDTARLAAVSGLIGERNPPTGTGADLIAGPGRRAPNDPTVRSIRTQVRGKSSGKDLILRTILFSTLSRGGRAVVFDVGECNTWMASVEPRDSVDFYTCVAEIHARLLRLRDEIIERTRRRESHIEQYGTSTAADAGDQLVIFIDSSVATRNLLNSYWATVRDSDDPFRSPAVEMFESLDFVGPGVNVHVLRGHASRAERSRDDQRPA
ncbi:hypothetical protein [Pseudonocardia spinosispora]|uniref:hypothetical protein n=1 Tax=Pseudonocardia spinosispora TaxID=103441 RepID=UPI00146FB57A|nr:hypothetical protein [Pseudonocardia spinosispora]